MNAQAEDLGIEVRRFPMSVRAFRLPLTGMVVGMLIFVALVAMDEGRDALRLLAPIAAGIPAFFVAALALVTRRSWVSIHERGLDVPRALAGRRRITWRQLGGIAQVGPRAEFAAVKDSEGRDAGQIPLATIEDPEFQRLLAQFLPPDSPLRVEDSE